MKVNISVISERKSVSLEIDELETIENLNKALATFLNVTEEYYFIYNELVCESSVTLRDLNLSEGGVIYAAKKSDKPLRRKLDNQYLSNILITGSQTKRFCTPVDENVLEHKIWQNTNLSEIQRNMNEEFIKDPFQFEPLILQPPVEQMIKNPSILNSLYSCNTIINGIIEKKPEQVKFYTDPSQYNWIQNVISDSSEMERISLHYSENYKNVLNSKRLKRMQDVFEKTSSVKDESTTEYAEYDESSLDVFKKSQYIQNLADLITQDTQLSEEILKSCPFGLNMCDENVADIQSVLPKVMDNFKKALLHQGDDKSIYQYLKNNPIEVDESLADRLEEVTGQLPENGFCEEGVADNKKIYEMLGKINSWVTLTPEEDENKPQKNYNKEIEILNEMGFTDNSTNLKVLDSEYGSLNRAVLSLVLP